jgi:hypothetical protein
MNIWTNYIVNPDKETYRLNLMSPKKTQDGDQKKKWVNTNGLQIRHFVIKGTLIKPLD